MGLAVLMAWKADCSWGACEGLGKAENRPKVRFGNALEGL